MGGWASVPASFAVIAAILAPSAIAADSVPGSRGEIASYLEIEQVASFSKSIERDLAANGARVALVFRAGQSRENLPDNIQYTHGAFWVYQDILKADGTVMKGYAVYNLYHGDGETLPKSRSYLEQDFPFDFVSGSKADDVAVIIPRPELQAKILGVISSQTYQTLHIEDYSLVSNVADPKYQNCNEFMLDVMAAGLWNTSDYAQIKANLATYFEPTVIGTNLFQRIFGPVVDDRLKTSDHHGQIETATYDSLAGFLETYDLLQETYVIERTESAIN